MTQIEKRLADLKAAQERGEYTLCPRCGQDTMKPRLYTNAMSRLADIQVCDVCGVDEAKLAFMQNPGTLYSWAGLQPERPASDFKTLPGAEVWEHVRKEQTITLFDLFNRFVSGEDPEEIRFSAFESCPGLTQIWTEPFQLKYACADGDLLIAFKKATDGNEMEASLIEK